MPKSKNNEKTIGMRLLLLLLAALTTNDIHAAAYGPDMPSHHFPTDTSFHLGYRLLTIRHSKNFVEPLLTEALDGGASVRVFRHELTPEFQPNRQFNFGARFRFDSTKLSPNVGDDLSSSSLSDQLFFLEYRFYDVPGSSVGLSTLIKFPLYSNTTLAALLASNNTSQTVLLGDGQIDYSFLLTTENWFGTTFRLQTNAGITIRTDGFAPQIPAMLSAGVVTPKMDFSLRVKGAFSLGQGTENNADIQNLRNAFANSNWALSPNPWLIQVEPSILLWISSKWAIHLEYTQTLMGNNSPSFNHFGVGFVYRWAKTKTKFKRNFEEVPIWVDQEAGHFEGESFVPQSESIMLQDDSNLNF